MKNLKCYLIPADCREDIPNINEHLKTLDINVVLKQLNNKFGKGKDGYFKIVHEIGTNNKSFVLSSPKSFIKYKNDVINELDLMMWYITREWLTDDWEIQIESKQPENCNNYVYKTCGGILYHVTDKDTAKYILKSGLRTKGKDRKNFDYRTFPSRNYFVVGKDSKDIKKAISIVQNSKELGSIDVAILKINLNNYPHKIDFYEDPFYNIKNMVYAYTKLPGVMIEEVTLEDI